MFSKQPRTVQTPVQQRFAAPASMSSSRAIPMQASGNFPSSNVNIRNASPMMSSASRVLHAPAHQPAATYQGTPLATSRNVAPVSYASQASSYSTQAAIPSQVQMPSPMSVRASQSRLPTVQHSSHTVAPTAIAASQSHAGHGFSSYSSSTPVSQSHTVSQSHPLSHGHNVFQGHHQVSQPYTTNQAHQGFVSNHQSIGQQNASMSNQMMSTSGLPTYRASTQSPSITGRSPMVAYGSPTMSTSTISQPQHTTTTAWAGQGQGQSVPMVSQQSLSTLPQVSGYMSARPTTTAPTTARGIRSVGSYQQPAPIKAYQQAAPVQLGATYHTTSQALPSHAMTQQYTTLAPYSLPAETVTYAAPHVDPQVLVPAEAATYVTHDPQQVYEHQQALIDQQAFADQQGMADQQGGFVDQQGCVVDQQGLADQQAMAEQQGMGMDPLEQQQQQEYEDLAFADQQALEQQQQEQQYVDEGAFQQQQQYEDPNMQPQVYVDEQGYEITDPVLIQQQQELEMQQRELEMQQQQDMQQMDPGMMQQADGTMVEGQEAAVVKQQVGDWLICQDAQGEFYSHQQTGQSYAEAPAELLALLEQQPQQ